MDKPSWTSPRGTRKVRTKASRLLHLKVRFVAESKFLVDLSQVDFDRPIATLDDIRRYNPQRFEMEQLTAVVLEVESAPHRPPSLRHRSTSASSVFSR